DPLWSGLGLGGGPEHKGGLQTRRLLPVAATPRVGFGHSAASSGDYSGRLPNLVCCPWPEGLPSALWSKEAKPLLRAFLWITITLLFKEPVMPTASTVRARLRVEALEARELPATNLWGLSMYPSPPQVSGLYGQPMQTSYGGLYSSQPYYGASY